MVVTKTPSYVAGMGKLYSMTDYEQNTHVFRHFPPQQYVFVKCVNILYLQTKYCVNRYNPEQIAKEMPQFSMHTSLFDSQRDHVRLAYIRAPFRVYIYLSFCSITVDLKRKVREP